jgi:hypothetical protein
MLKQQYKTRNWLQSNQNYTSEFNGNEFVWCFFRENLLYVDQRLLKFINKLYRFAIKLKIFDEYAQLSSNISKIIYKKIENSWHIKDNFIILITNRRKLLFPMR